MFNKEDEIYGWIRYHEEEQNLPLCCHVLDHPYDLFFTIFGSIADETHTALMEEWLRDTWIPFVSQ